jgi:hypothetical protein
MLSSGARKLICSSHIGILMFKIAPYARLVLIPGPSCRLLWICRRCTTWHRFVAGICSVCCIVFLISLSLDERALRSMLLAIGLSSSYYPRYLSKLLHACCVHSVCVELDGSYASSACSPPCACGPVSSLCILPRGAIEMTKSQLGGAH